MEKQEGKEVLETSVRIFAVSHDRKEKDDGQEVGAEEDGLIELRNKVKDEEEDKVVDKDEGEELE